MGVVTWTGVFSPPARASVGSGPTSGRKCVVLPECGLTSPSLRRTVLRVLHRRGSTSSSEAGLEPVMIKLERRGQWASTAWSPCKGRLGAMNRQNGILSQYYFHHPSFRYPAGISTSVDPHKSSLTSLGLHHSAPGIAAFVALGSPLEVAGDPGRSCAGSQDDLKLGCFSANHLLGSTSCPASCAA